MNMIERIYHDKEVIVYHSELEGNIRAQSNQPLNSIISSF